MSYLPTVAWETLVDNVTQIDSVTYTLSIANINPNDPGASTNSVAVGFYIMDWVGHIYTISEINVGSDPLRIKVTDDFIVGVGPQQGRLAYIYKSVGDGVAPYISPIRFERLDPSAMGYALPIIFDIFYKSIGSALTGTTNNLPKFVTGGVDDSLFSDDGTTPKYNGYKIWTENNDGTGSGLDADTIDGIQGNRIALATDAINIDLNTVFVPGLYRFNSGISNIPVAGRYYSGVVYGNGANVVGQLATDFITAESYIRAFNSSFSSWRKIYDSLNSNLSTVDWTAKNLTAQSNIIPYAALSFGSTVTWDTSTGVDKTLTATGNFTLAMTNLVNGMSGDLRLNITGVTTITLPTSKINGSVASLAIGIYHLCFVYDGTNLEFNIAKYA